MSGVAGETLLRFNPRDLEQTAMKQNKHPVHKSKSTSYNTHDRMWGGNNYPSRQKTWLMKFNTELLQLQLLLSSSNWDRRKFFTTLKAVYEKPTAKRTIEADKLKAFHFKSLLKTCTGKLVFNRDRISV